MEPAHRHDQIIVHGQTLDVQRPLLEGLHPCWHDHEVIVAFVSSGKISVSRHMPDEPVRKEASSFLVGGRRTRLIEGPGCAQIPLLDISHAVSISQRPIQPVRGFCSLSVTPTTTSASRWTVVYRGALRRTDLRTALRDIPLTELQRTHPADCLGDLLKRSAG
jgi:hypothetical protein